MDQVSLESALADLPLPALRFFRTIDSTNDEAWRWLDAGALHGALVIADEQTAGHGRLQRHWVTAAGGGLAFSLVLLSPPLEPSSISRLTGLGALAVCLTLQRLHTHTVQIKWPNDILLDNRKVGGILVEARWIGDTLHAVVIGIGINIAPISISPDILPAETLNFPATFVEHELGGQVDRMEFLHTILQEFFSWLPRLGSSEFIKAWEDNLAYRNQWVELSSGYQDPSLQGSMEISRDRQGTVIGLASDGSLLIENKSGAVASIQVGEITLRPVPWPTSG